MIAVDAVALSPLVTTLLGGVAGAIAGLLGGFLTRRHDIRSGRFDRIRKVTVALVEAATRVGEGDAESHADVRSNYHLLLIETSSSAVQAAARGLVRTSWNVAAAHAGRERKRPAPENVAPSKEVRHAIRPLIEAVRVELKVRGSLAIEPDD